MLRVSELKALTVASVDLDGDSPQVHLKPAQTKAKKATPPIPLRRVSAETLRSLLADKADDEPILPMPHRSSFSKMLNADFADAGIEKKNARGEVLGFHGLRHTFMTNLARSGVHPSVAHALARHSDVRLTLGVYTHADRSEQTRAVEGCAALVPIPRSRRIRVHLPWRPAYRPRVISAAFR